MEDKTITFKWIIYSLFFLFFGYGVGYLQPFEKQIENLMAITGIFILGSFLGVIAMSGLRGEGNNE